MKSLEFEDDPKIPSTQNSNGDFPKFRGILLGVSIIRIIVFGGLYWGTPILGNYRIPTQNLC